MNNQKKIVDTINFFKSKMHFWFKKNKNFEKRLVFDKCWSTLNDENNHEFIILNGLRQVGKTTVLQQLAHEIFKKFQNSDESIIYISLDQILISGVKVEDFMVFLNENINPEKNLYIFLDEIQVLEKWDIFLKNVWDSFPNIKIIASGSSSLLINLEETGGFRFKFLKVEPLSFKEYLIFRDKDILLNLKELPKLSAFQTISRDELIQINFNSSRLKPFFKNYVFSGSYPKGIFQNLSLFEYQELILNNVYQKTKDDVFKSYLKNLKKIYSVKINPANFDAIFWYLIENNASEMSYRTLSEKLKISKEAVYQNFQLLIYGSLLNSCPRIDFNGKFSSNVKFKYYLTDHTFFSAVKQFRHFSDLGDKKGFVYENLIFNYLHQNQFYDKLGFIKLKKSEIDFALFLKNGQKYLFESKSNNWDTKGVNDNFSLPEAKNFLKICITEDYLERKNEILYIPIYLFLLLQIV